MKTLTCSAPGKLFLSGEYAVLSGAEAVITAVNARATARPVERGRPMSPVLHSVYQQAMTAIEEEFGFCGDPGLIEVETARFEIAKKKIGLGSSSAVAAAACGALFELAGLPILNHKQLIFDITAKAHCLAQGGRGSGGDVAAAVFGGTLVFSTATGFEHFPLPDIEIVPVWSGQAASTAELLKLIEAFADRAPESHAECMAELCSIAEQLASAYRASDKEQILSGTARYGEAMAELGKAARASIVTKEHALIGEIAGDLGGAAKPSGAGGGDIAVALFRDRDAAQSFRSACLRIGMKPLDLEVDEEGLKRDLPG